jgi:hypothetical protein
LLQYRGVQIVRQAMKVAPNRGNVSREHPESVPALGWHIARVSCQDRQLDRQYGQTLGDVIVQFTSNANALLLMSVDKTSPQITKFVLESLTAGRHEHWH